jgi:hypothetical protein
LRRKLPDGILAYLWLANCYFAHNSLRGAAHEIRFADDAVLCFQYKEDAERVMEVLPKRFAKHGLTIHPEKTRLLEFGRYAEENAKRQGKKAATFDFLGFTYVCARSRKGKFKHQLLILNRSRQRSPNLSSWDRILAGWMALLMRPRHARDLLRISTLGSLAVSAVSSCVPV